MPARRDQGIGLSPSSEIRSPATPGILAVSPWQMMRRMQEDMDRIFGQFMGGGGISPVPASAPLAVRQLAPSMDLSEDSKEWGIEVDLPGGKPDDVDVRLQNHHLTLQAEIRPEEEEGRREEAGRRYLRQERRYGFIETGLPLPENVREDAARGEFRNGVLTVHLPKSAQQQEQGRRILVGESAAREENATAQQDQAAQGQAGPSHASAQQSDRAEQRGSQGAGQEEEDQERQTAGAGAARDRGQNNRA